MRTVRYDLSPVQSWPNKKCQGMPLPTGEEFNPRSLEDIFRSLPDPVDEASIPSAATFMRRCMTLDPDLRSSAKDLLADDWLEAV
jgi:serine/threonine protein kinase